MVLAMIIFDRNHSRVMATLLYLPMKIQLKVAQSTEPKTEPWVTPHKAPEDDHHHPCHVPRPTDMHVNCLSIGICLLELPV